MSAYNSTEEIITGDAYDFRPRGDLDLPGPARHRSQPEPVPRSVVLEPGGPLHFATRKAACAGSPARTTCTPTGSSPPATWWMTGTGVFPVYHEPRLSGQQPERHVPRRFAEQRRLGGVRRRDLRDHRQARARRGGALRRGQAREHHRDAERLPARSAPPASRARCARTPGARRSPRPRCATSPTTTSRCSAAGAAASAAAASIRSGVGAVADASGIAGVNDLFEAEVADTWEVGFKGQFLDRRLNVGLSRVRHPVDQRLLLRVPRGELHAEPRQPRRRLPGRGVRDQRARSPTTSSCSAATATPTARSPAWKILP